MYKNNRSTRNQKFKSNKFRRNNQGEQSLSPKDLQRYEQSRDKYLKLSHEARAGGDRIAEQNYLQFADHYCRLVSEIEEQLNIARIPQAENIEAVVDLVEDGTC